MDLSIWLFEEKFFEEKMDLLNRKLLLVSNGQLERFLDFPAVIDNDNIPSPFDDNNTGLIGRLCRMYVFYCELYKRTLN